MDLKLLIKMVQNASYIFLILFLIISCRTSRRLDKNAFTDFMVSELWRIDSCNESTLIDTLLNWAPDEQPNLTISKIEHLLGKPVHKQYQENSIVLLYYLGGRPNCKRCPFGDLYYIEFDKAGKFKGSSIFFISDGTWKDLRFWYSSQPDSVSIRSETTNEFYLSIPH